MSKQLLGPNGQPISRDQPAKEANVGSGKFRRHLRKALAAVLASTGLCALLVAVYGQVASDRSAQKATELSGPQIEVTYWYGLPASDYLDGTNTLPERLDSHGIERSSQEWIELPSEAELDRYVGAACDSPCETGLTNGTAFLVIKNSGGRSATGLNLQFTKSTPELGAKFRDLFIEDPTSETFEVTLPDLPADEGLLVPLGSIFEPLGDQSVYSSSPARIPLELRYQDNPGGGERDPLPIRSPSESAKVFIDKDGLVQMAG